MRRILFVDDEPRILEGLRRLLRPYRNEWQTSFASGGAEALSHLQSNPVDVVVTDMRMPGIDGAQLLGHVRERYPSTVRIVLSGYFDAEAALRAAPVAHQFLMKPCDLTKLRRAIDNACAIDAILTDAGIRRAVSAIGSLPAMPRTCGAVIRAMEGSEEVTTGDLCRLVQGDVGLAAKVLQVAGTGSPERGSPSSLEDAVSALGAGALRRLVLCLELFETFRSERPIRGFSLDYCQSHARLVAAVAATLPTPEDARGQVSAAAYLHDVGQLVLASRFPVEFESAIAEAKSRQRPLYELELEFIGANHAQVGAYLLALWGMAPEVVGAVACHHSAAADWEITGTMTVATVICLADSLVHDWMDTRGAIDYLGTFRKSPSLERWREATAALAGETRR